MCTIECCLRKLKLDYRQKCIISLIFHMLVIQIARLYFERLVLIFIYSGWGVVRRYTLPEGTSCTLNRLGRNVTSGESNAPWHPLGRVQQHLPVSLQAPRLKWILQCPIERTPNRACDSQTTYHHAAATSLPVNRGGHLLNIKISFFDKNWNLAGGCELEAVNHSQDLVKVSPFWKKCNERAKNMLLPLVEA